MKDSIKLNSSISIVGLGVAVGALAPVIRFPVLLLFALGLGMTIGGAFRAIRQIERKLTKNETTDKTL